MVELALIYLLLGGLAALAQGRWSVRDMARATLLWPALLPTLLREDPSPPDRLPGFSAWDQRISAAASQLARALKHTPSLPDARAEVKLLEDSRRDLVMVARRHAELSEVLRAPEHDLAALRRDLATAPEARRHILARRAAHTAQLHQARERLETHLEEGLAALMNVTARLHLARATDAPLPALRERLSEIAAAVDGVVEAEEIVHEPLSAPLAPELELAGRELARVDLVAPPRETLEARRPDPALEELLSPAPAEHALVAPPRLSRAEVEALLSASGEVPPQKTPDYRRAIVGTVGALGLISLVINVLYSTGLGQTSALFIGVPTVLAMIVGALPRPKSGTGMAMYVTTLLLLVSGIFLAEGFICILMSAPLFYLCAVIVGLGIDYAKMEKRNRARQATALPLLFMAMEGAVPGLDFPREEVVTVSAHLDASPDQVEANLAELPRADSELPLFLQLGFPRPVSAVGAMQAPGDERSVHFAGGAGHPGDLRLRVLAREPGRIQLELVEDTSHIAYWLSWESSELTWEPDGTGTRVSCTLRYRRELDPAWWFGPIERYAVGQAARHLIDDLEAR